MAHGATAAGTRRDKDGAVLVASNAFDLQPFHNPKDPSMRTEDTEHGRLDHWSPEDLAAAFARNEVAIIDVRTPQEFAFEHLHGALLAPLATFEPRNLPSQQGKALVFHCGSGVRSRKVAEACLAAGIAPVAHLEGGFGAWKAAGLPYVTIDPTTGNVKHVDPAAG